MNTYTGNELDEKINKFLAKRTQKFPELQQDSLMTKTDERRNRFVNPLEKASILWTQYIHA